MRALIVDANPITFVELKDLLGRIGVDEVHWALNASAAWEHLDAGAIDLIFVDHWLDGLRTGADFVREVLERRRRGSARIVFLAKDRAHEDFVREVLRGVKDTAVLFTPYDAEEVRRIVAAGAGG